MKIDRALWGLVALSALTSAAVTLGQRLPAEEQYRRVEIAVPLDEIRTQAALAGTPEPVLWQQLRRAGVTGILLSEPTIGDLAAAGALQILPGDSLTGAPPSGAQIITGNASLYARLRGQLAAFTGSEPKTAGDGQPTGTSSPDVPHRLSTPLPPSALVDMGAGFSGEWVSEVARQGFHPILQLHGENTATPEGIRRIFDRLRTLPHVSAVTFQDDPLPGYPDHLNAVGDALRQWKVALAPVEFYPQKGMDELAKSLAAQVVPLHAVSRRDPLAGHPGAVMERYVHAAKERNQRLLLVHPSVVGTGFTETIHWLSDLHRELVHAGLQPGGATGAQALEVAPSLFAATGLGVLAAGMLLLRRFGFGHSAWMAGLSVFVLWVVWLLTDPIPARKAMALAAAVMFPTLALVAFTRPCPRTVWQALAASAGVFLVSLTGAGCVAALLADRIFLIKADQFTGVKAAALLPPLLAYGLLAVPGEGSQSRLASLRRQLAQPVTAYAAGAAALVAAVLAVYLLRSGNGGSLAVFPMEPEMRNWMEHFLGVRPRTKEVLLGYPALLLLLVFGRRSRASPFLLLLAGIGQASLVDTFAHIHTPLAVSFQRATEGAVLGMALGLILLSAYRIAASPRRRTIHG